MIESFRTIATTANAKLGEGEPFDLDFMVAALVEALQVSSSGASGATALQRSTREDRSRDPLYNQLKMYSELYRMLGWLHVSGKRLSFVVSPLGQYIAANYPKPAAPETLQLATESVLSITFPNPHTDNLGIDELRPFPLLLRLMAALDGLTRDEMLISLFPIANDRSGTAFDLAVDRVSDLRGDFAGLQEELERVAEGRQVNTLKNYTRFPIGVIQAPSVSWACSERNRSLYGRSVVVLKLSERGATLAAALAAIVDVRETDLAGFSVEERSHFALIAAYAMVERAGFSLDEVLPIIQKSTGAAKGILDSLGIASRQSILYSPYQQAPKDVLDGIAALDT
jgi:hypothetical protein